MKSLRISALMLALGAFSICSMPVHAQQEVDPDHFDRPIAASKHVQGAKTQGYGATGAQHQTNKKLAVAPSRKTHHKQNPRQTSGSSDTAGN